MSNLLALLALAVGPTQSHEGGSVDTSLFKAVLFPLPPTPLCHRQLSI